MSSATLTLALLESIFDEEDDFLILEAFCMTEDMSLTPMMTMALVANDRDLLMHLLIERMKQELEDDDDDSSMSSSSSDSDGESMSGIPGME
jgi:hypothetical protein